MFRFVKSLTFWWPVKVREPDPNKPGTTVEHEFEAQFSLIGDEEAKASRKTRLAIVDHITPDLSPEETLTVQDELDAHDRDAMARVLKGWRGIVDTDNTPIDFSAEAFATLWNERRFRAALARAYTEAIDEDGGRLKN